MVGGLVTKTTGIVLDVARQRGGAEPSVVTLHDFSRFHNDGAFVNSPTWVQLASGLWVLNFVRASNQYIQCGTDVSLSPRTNSYTKELWMKATTNPIAGLMGQYDGDTPLNPSHFLRYNVDKIRFSWQGTGGGAHTDEATINTGQWYHIVGVRDVVAGLVHLYVDGAEYGTANADGSGDVNTTSEFRIVRAPWYFDGQVALLRVYKYALTPGQILQRFEATRKYFGV